VETDVTLRERLRLTAAAVAGWWFEPLPRGRVAALRVIVYGFVFLDVLVLRPWVMEHGDLPHELYSPLLVGRALPLPTPTPLFVRAIALALIVGAVVAMTGRAARSVGAAVFVLYFEWMLIAFSYGKVDHDRLAFLVALAVLPTVGRARLGQGAGSRSRDEASGFALHCIQVAVVLTYLLSVVAKIRFGGGIEWLNGPVLARAIVRRGSFLADPFLDYPWLLQTAQYAIVAFELGTPLLLVRGRVGRAYLGATVVFHAVTFAFIGLMFWPHVVCLSAFLPLEKLGDARALARASPRPRVGQSI